MHKRKVLGFTAAVLGGLFIGGCSTVQVHPVTVAQANDPSISGVRFFQPMPYLLVTQVPSHPHPMGPMMGGPHPGGPRGGHGRHGPMAMRGGPEHGHGDHHGDQDADGGSHGKEHKGDRGEHGHKLQNGHKLQHGMKGRRGPGHRPPPPRMMMAQQRVLCLQIIYLPDYSHPYVADLKGGMGHSPNSIVLANGWELLGINAKGHLTEPAPIRAMTAMPMMPPMRGPGPKGRPMHGPHHGWKQHGISLQHHHHNNKMMRMKAAPLARKGHGGAWRMQHRMMMHKMMMSRQAAMAMGLHPGLYRLVFSPKTGELVCLKPIKMMMHHGHFHHAWKGHLLSR